MSTTRRGLLAQAWRWTGVALAAGGAMLMGRALGGRSRGRSSAAIAPIAPIAIDETRLQGLRNGPVVIEGILVRGTIDHPRALDLSCTHLGCPLRLDRQRRELGCPCHGSRFDLDGNPKAGPATEPLASRTLTKIGHQWIVGPRP